MKRKVRNTIVLSAIFAAAISGTALAGEWKQDTKGWRWQFEDGSYLKSRVATLDGNKDGFGENYEFGEDGYMLVSTTATDGSKINAEGQLLKHDGTVLQMQVSTSYVNELPGALEGYYLGDIGWDDWDKDGVKEKEYTIYYGYGIKVLDDNTISVLSDQVDNMIPFTYYKVSDGVYERNCTDGVDRMVFSGGSLTYTCSAYNLEERFKRGRKFFCVFRGMRPL